MEWTKYTIHTGEDAEEAILSLLSELNITGAEISDKKPLSVEENGGLFGDVVPEMPEDDGSCEISFYVDSDMAEETKADLLTKLRDGLARIGEFLDIGEGAITEETTRDEDWVNNWKQYFHSFYVDDILIEPTWEASSGEEAEKDAAMILHIDPGTAFGTGAHESTQLAIRSIRKYVRNGDRILDIGTGSGILGIVALKSGAGHVFGTDIDENTIPAISDNLRENGISEDSFEVILGNIADDPKVQDAAGYEMYDIAAANIIAEILANITPEVPRHLKKGGIYITSGILTEREDVVLRAAEAAGFTLLEVNRMGEWSGMVFRK